MALIFQVPFSPTGPLSDVERGLIPEYAHGRSSRPPERSPRRPLLERELGEGGMATVYLTDGLRLCHAHQL